MESSCMNKNNSCSQSTAAVNGIDREDEIELELGLGIGISVGENCNTRLQKFVSIQNKAHGQKIGHGMTELGFGVQVCARSRGSSGLDSEHDMDPKRKREIHALRRQEAKKKRGEKQLKRALSKGSLVVDVASVGQANAVYLNGVSHNDSEEPECKRSKTANFSIESAPSIPSGSQGLLMALVPHPAALQLGVSAHGVVSSESERNVIRQVRDGHDLEKQDGEGRSNESAICTSSIGSDYRSSPCQGPSGSSNSKSQSMHEEAQLNGGTGSSGIKRQSEETATSDLIEPISGAMKCIEAIKTSLNYTQSHLHNPKGESKSDRNTWSVENPETSLSKNRNPPECDKDAPPALPYMPCVSTTGNGPNGKTVHGFLYRYTKEEVSIICVCHGSSFSPIEFVKHAGGAHVCHPLKHITVLPPTI